MSGASPRTAAATEAGGAARAAGQGVPKIEMRAVAMPPAPPTSTTTSSSRTMLPTQPLMPHTLPPAMKQLTLPAMP